MLSNGIIPACAGNSSREPKERDRCRDHPRVCGEQFVSKMWPDIMKGSSPRVRGTDIAGECIPNTNGIIPACAGNRQLLLLQQ